MVVAVVAVRVVEAPIDEVVHVVPVRDRLVPAVRAVLVPIRMACRRRRVATGVGIVDREGVLVDMVLVRMVEVAIVEVVDVAVVDHGGVPAVRAVLVGVIAVDVMLAHGRTVRRCPPHAEQTGLRLVLGCPARRLLGKVGRRAGLAS